MAAVSLTLEVPIFNFDIIQGQDLDLPVSYVTEGVADTMLGASLKMELRLADYSKVMDTLSTTNSRIVITGANAFTLKFPSTVTSAYKLTTPTLKLIYDLELTTNITKKIFGGDVTVKRERTK